MEFELFVRTQLNDSTHRSYATRSYLNNTAGGDKSHNNPTNALNHVMRSVRGSTGEFDNNQRRSDQGQGVGGGGERGGSLRPPIPSTASLHFSDSELQHYRTHSTRTSQSSLPAHPAHPTRTHPTASSVESLPHSAHGQQAAQIAHLTRNTANRAHTDMRDDHPPRPPPPPPSHVKRFAHPDDTTSVLGASMSKLRQEASPTNIRISFDGDRGDRGDRGDGVRGSGGIGGEEGSVMQRRAELLADMDLRASSSSLDRVSDRAVPPPPAETTDNGRFGRLQNMYERLTGKGVPSPWRDSESSDSD